MGDKTQRTLIWRVMDSALLTRACVQNSDFPKPNPHHCDLFPC